MPAWLFTLILSSTLAGLLFAAFAMWLNFKEKQGQIATSTNELERTVANQKKALDAAEQRIRNLETIVTSQTWDAVHTDELTETEDQRTRSQSRLDLDSLEDEPSDAERAAHLARRLKP